MFAAILPYLMTAGNVGVAYQGGKLILQGAEEVTGIPVAKVADCFIQTIIDDCRDTFKNVTHPVVSGIENTVSYISEKALPREPALVGASALEPPIEDVLRDAEAKRQAGAQFAGRKAARAASMSVGSREQIETANQSRASSRLAKLSRLLEARARSTKDVSGSTSASSAAYRNYAMASLDAAEASMAPPTDPRDVLASEDVSGDEKAAITYIIDAINRDQEPDYEVLADRYVLANSYPVSGQETAGHGHDHGHSDGASCSCGGSCGPCAAKLKAKAAARVPLKANPEADIVAGAWGDDVPALPVSNVAPSPVTVTDVAGSWGEDLPQEDLSWGGAQGTAGNSALPKAHWMDPIPQGCTTGCSVPIPRRRR